MSDKQPCPVCGYIEDASAWHYEDCIIMDDPMTMWHITKIHEQRLEINRLKRQYEIAMDLIQSWKVNAQCITSWTDELVDESWALRSQSIKAWTDELVQFAESPEHGYSEVVESHRITLHISSTATQEASCDVPYAVIIDGPQAVFHYIIGNDDTEYTDYDYDNLDNEGLSWATDNSDVAHALRNGKAPSYLWTEPKPSVQQLMDKLMSGTTLSTDELMILYDSVNQEEE